LQHSNVAKQIRFLPNNPHQMHSLIRELHLIRRVTLMAKSPSEHGVEDVGAKREWRWRLKRRRWLLLGVKWSGKCSRLRLYFVYLSFEGFT